MADDLPRRFGDYALIESIGGGGMGLAHLAIRWPREKDPTPVVVKTLRADRLEEPESRARFAQEAKLALSVTHPHIARVYDVGLVGSEPYFAMEYIPGVRLSGCLDALAKRKAHLPIAELPAALAGLFDGMQALHDAVDAEGSRLEIVHRDVCPKNMIVDPMGQLRLIDLGIGWSPRNEWHTATGLVVGTPSHMSPEQVTGKPIDHRSDLYTLAIAIFELITLQRYATPRGVPELLRFAASPVFRAPSAARNDVPIAIDLVLQKALSVDPNARFPSARDLEAALREAVGPSATVTPAVLRKLIGELYDPAHVEKVIRAPLAIDRTEGEPVTVIARREDWVTNTITSPGVPAQLVTSTKMMQTRPWSAVNEAPRGRWLRAAIVPALTLGIGIAIGAQMSAKDKPPVVQQPVAPAPPTERPRIGAVQGVATPAPSVSPRAEPPPPPSPVRVRPPPAVVAERAPLPAEPPRTAEPPADTMESLRARALQLKRARPDRARAADELLADLAAERGSASGPELTARLGKLSARMSALER